jgi:hypothetical protein
MGGGGTAERARAWGSVQPCAGRSSPARLAHDVRTGGVALGSIRCAGPRVARSRPARAEQAEACHAWHIPQHMVQGPLHVVPRLVPGLQMFDRHLAQMVAMAAATAELADGLRRTQRRCQHPIQRPRLEPATRTASRVRTPRAIVDRAGRAASDRKAAGCEDVQQRHRVAPGGCHHHGGHTPGCSPVGEPMPVPGKRTPCLDRWGIAVRGHTDPVCLSPHLKAGSLRVEAGHRLEGGRVLLAFFRPTCLPSGEEQGKTGLLLRKNTRGGGERRDCFILIEPARSVGGTLTWRCT